MTSIPRTFHWIWFGDRRIPEQHQRWIDGWLALHPEWTHQIWTDQHRPVLRNEAQFLAAGNPAMKADIARYEILYRYGGVYVDTDFECIRSIEPLLDGVEAFSAAEKPDSLTTLGIGVMGASPGHPWLAELIELLPHAIQTQIGIRKQTGPVFAQLVTLRHPEVTIFPERIFRHERRPAYNDTCAIHHGSHSWREAEDLKYAAAFRELLSEDIEPIVPPGAVFIMVDKGRSHETGGGRRSVPFPEHDGAWGGYPVDDAAAVAELDRLRGAGAEFMVFPQPMFYWLDAYPELRARLENEARRVVDNERTLIFDLRRSRRS
jgi:hypothetical protein